MPELDEVPIDAQVWPSEISELLPHDVCRRNDEFEFMTERYSKMLPLLDNLDHETEALDSFLGSNATQESFLVALSVRKIGVLIENIEYLHQETWMTYFHTDIRKQDEGLTEYMERMIRKASDSVNRAETMEYETSMFP